MEISSIITGGVVFAALAVGFYLLKSRRSSKTGRGGGYRDTDSTKKQEK